MKRIHTLTTIVLPLTALSFYLQAQERPLLTATVPFAFGVANVSLPAGSYTVSILPPYNMIQVQSADGRKVATITAIPRYSNVRSRYFLLPLSVRSRPGSKRIDY